MRELEKRYRREAVRLETQGIRGWHWLVIALLALLPGTFLLLPLFSWLIARRAPQPVGSQR